MRNRIRKVVSLLVAFVFLVSFPAVVNADELFDAGSLTGSGISRLSAEQKQKIVEATQIYSGTISAPFTVASTVSPMNMKSLVYNIIGNNFAVGTFNLQFTLNNGEFAYFANTVTSTDLITSYPAGTLQAVKYADAVNNVYPVTSGQSDVKRIVELKYTGSKGLPYVLTVDPANPTKMNVQYTTTSSTDKNNAFVEIPLSVITKNYGNINASLNSDCGMILSVNQFFLSDEEAPTGTDALSAGVVYGVDNINLKKVTLKELAPNVFAINENGNSAFVVQAPSGYHFGNLAEKISVDRGRISSVTTSFIDSKNKSMAVTISGSTGSSTSANYIELEDLVLVKDEGHTPNGEALKLSFRNADAYDGSFVSANILDEELLVAYAKDVKMELYVDEVLTMYGGDKKFTDGPALSVTIREPELKFWLSAKKATDVSLVDANGHLLNGVKFDILDISSKGFDTNSKPDIKQLQPSPAKLEGNLSFNEDVNVITFEKLVPASANYSDKLEMTLNMRLSADLAFGGDVYLSLSGASIPSGEDRTANMIKIATVKPKIEIKTISSAYSPNGDSFSTKSITITELVPGAIQNIGVGADLVVRLINDTTGKTAGEVGFLLLPDSSIEVKGDLQLKTLSKSGSRFEFQVTKPSTVASSITFKDLTVKKYGTKVDYFYSIAVEGKGLRSNYIDSESKAIGTSDFFTDGVKFDKYLDLTGIGLPSTNPLSKKIEIYANSKTVYVDGVAKEMETPPLVINNRLYIPLRFISEFFGASQDDVKWDGTVGSGTVKLAGRTAVFTLDSEYYLDANGNRKMMIEDGIVSKPIAYQQRIYIPYRYLAYAFDIPVGYDAATGAAVYNPSK